jgi:hypothetical protein
MTVVVTPPQSPTTVAGELADAAVTSAVSDQLTQTRTAADNWQKGLAGLVTLLAAVLFIKGKDTIDKLNHDWQIALAVALLIAALFAVIGSFRLFSAAYGEPTETELATIRDEGLYVWNTERAADAARSLRDGQYLWVLTLVFFALAVAISWFGEGPAKTAAFQILNPAANACGDLQAADNGQFKIVQDSTSSAIVSKSDLAALKVVKECP